MKQLSLDALRTFVAIIDHGGFARAGDVLGRSQPAISLQIKKLESQIDKKLFTKQGQRYLANTQGMWLYEHAKHMLQLNDEVFTHMKAEELSGQIKLGIPSEFASLLLPSLIGEFAKQYPDISLDVTSNLSRSLLSSENNETYDVILALVEDKASRQAARWVTDQIVWVGDANYQPNQQQLSLVLASEGCVYRKRVITTLKQQTLPWRIAYTNSDLGGLNAAMQQGLGITALAKRSVPDNLNIVRHKHLPVLGNIHIGLFNNTDHRSSTRHQTVTNTLIEFLASRLMSRV